MSRSSGTFGWRSIILPALLPTLLFSIGEGAIIPIIPLAAGDVGATVAIAGLVAGALTIGELLGNLPSAWLVSRVGERWAMIGGSIASIMGAAICLVAEDALILAVGIFLIGLATAVFSLARHAFMTTFVPLNYRGRALSTLGGTFRAGLFFGPMLAAAVIDGTGDVNSAFWIHAAMCGGAALVLFTLPDPSVTFGAVRAARASGDPVDRITAEPSGLFETFRRNARVLSRVGVGAALMAALRSSRSVILPLWALSIGLDAPTTALIIGIAGAVDFGLFYAGGAVMDRFGRLWAVLPSMGGLGVGHLVLSVTHDLPSNVDWFIAATLGLAAAHGIGSGILMTLGADLADRRNPAPFLGVWRLTSGVGGASAPIVIAGVTAAGSISLAAATMGALGIVGVAFLARYVPRYAQRQTT